MPKGGATSERNSKTPTRGPYATQACSVCRLKKSKCDGKKPVCSSCASSGRENECSWKRDSYARKPRTDAHFEALRKRADSLQSYVDLLQGLLAKCVCQDLLSSLQCLSQESGTEECSSADTLDSDEVDMTHELTAPTHCLRFDDKLGGLLLRSFTGPLQFGKTPPDVQRIMEVTNDLNPSYVLLVDGVEITDSDAEVDWSRHLPRQVALDRREHDRILDLAFKFFTSSSLRIVPFLFLRDMHCALSCPRSCKVPRTPHYSPMLHNIFLAVSSVFSDNPYIRDRKTRQYFVNVALDNLQAECRRPELSLVQAFAFFGTYYADSGDRILGDLFFAMSSRASLALGLGVDSATWAKAGLITYSEMQARHWACWTTFSLDVCCAMYFGRDLCGLSRRIIPKPFVDEELDQVPCVYSASGIPPQPNLLTRTFSESSSLFLIAREIIDTISGMCDLYNAADIEAHVTYLDLQLNNWKSGLPSQLEITPANRDHSTPHKFMLHCQYWWCFIILHGPFSKPQARTVQRSDREIDHVKLCKHAAESILELVSAWSAIYTLRYTPDTLLQPLFSAGTVFLLLALQAATRPIRIAHGALQAALEHAEACVNHLHDMGRTWTCAARAGDVLSGLLRERLGPIITRHIAHGGVPLQIATATYATTSRAGHDESSAAYAGELPPYTPHWREEDDWTQRELVNGVVDPTSSPFDLAEFWLPAFDNLWNDTMFASAEDSAPLF